MNATWHRENRRTRSREIEFIWDRSNPFVIDAVVSVSEVDGYGHVSTHNYIKWMIDCAFDHSTAVGLPESTCRKLARGMAAVKFNVDLLGSAYEQDRLRIATWIVESDGKLRLSRQFQIINADTNKTLARGLFNFVCTNLDNGRPTRLPPLFLERYIVASEPL